MEIEDSLMVEEGVLVKFPLDLFHHLSPSPAVPTSRFYFHQEEVKQPHCGDTQIPKIMNCLGPPEAADHLPLATLLCLTEQCNHCVKNFKQELQTKNSLSKHMLVVHGASRF